jgi:hypothetical protein
MSGLSEHYALPYLIERCKDCKCHMISQHSILSHGGVFARSSHGVSNVVGTPCRRAVHKSTSVSGRGCHICRSSGCRGSACGRRPGASSSTATSRCGQPSSASCLHALTSRASTTAALSPHLAQEQAHWHGTSSC